jgi:hypothetical protein
VLKKHAVITCALVATVTLHAQELFIDVFALNREHPIETIPTSDRIRSGTVISPHGQVLRPPFDVTLVALDAPTYMIPTPEPFAFEVRLRPWKPRNDQPWQLRDSPCARLLVKQSPVGCRNPNADAPSSVGDENCWSRHLPDCLFR